MAGKRPGRQSAAQSAASQKVEATTQSSLARQNSGSRCHSAQGLLTLQIQENKTTTGRQITGWSSTIRRPHPRPPSARSRMRIVAALARGRGRGGGERRKGSGWARRRPRPLHQRFCAYSVRQLLVVSMRQPTPCSFRVRTSEVSLVVLLLESSCEKPLFVLCCERKASVGPFSPS